MEEPVTEPLAVQTGFGLAAWLTLTALLKDLERNEIISRDRIKEILEEASLNAETGQAYSQFPDSIKAARLTLRFAIEVFARMDRQKQAPPKPD